MIALSHNREEIVRLLLEEDYIIKVPQEGLKEDYDEEEQQQYYERNRTREYNSVVVPYNPYEGLDEDD